MLERSSLVIRGRGEATKKRQQIDLLLKKAMKGDGRAKLKLYRDFGIKLYSAGEVEKYVQKRMPQEYAPGTRGPSNGPAGLARKTGPKHTSKNRIRQTRSTRQPSRSRVRKKGTVTGKV